MERFVPTDGCQIVFWEDRGQLCGREGRCRREKSCCLERTAKDPGAQDKEYSAVMLPKMSEEKAWLWPKRESLSVSLECVIIPEVTRLNYDVIWVSVVFFSNIMDTFDSNPKTRHIKPACQIIEIYAHLFYTHLNVLYLCMCICYMSITYSTLKSFLYFSALAQGHSKCSTDIGLVELTYLCRASYFIFFWTTL